MTFYPSRRRRPYNNDINSFNAFDNTIHNSSSSNDDGQSQQDGPTAREGVSTKRRGSMLGFSIPVGHSDRKPLSIEENQRENPTSRHDDILYGVPGATLLRSRDRLFNSETGWYDV